LKYLRRFKKHQQILRYITNDRVSVVAAPTAEQTSGSAAVTGQECRAVAASISTNISNQ